MQSKVYIYHKQDHLKPHFIGASSHTKDFTPFNLHIHNNVFKTLQLHLLTYELFILTSLNVITTLMIQHYGHLSCAGYFQHF